jgi:5-methyltetrahydrofolate--homocysteine methyltransferase
METTISSAAKEVIIGDSRPTVLIGERINPSGKKKMSEALQSGNLDILCQEATAQAEAGADIIDINVNAMGVDEVTMLPRVVRLVMETVDVPLCLDSPNPEALEAGLKVYKGKPLINSVTGEERSMEQVFPLVKEYGAAVVALPQDDQGIPAEPQRRVEIARRIVERAEAFGVSRENVIIDCLALAVGADQSAGSVTIETARRIKAELGVNLTLGASNISFGLPDRHLINNAFAAIVISAGINSLIVDAARVRPLVLAADVVLGNDKYAMRYIKAYRATMKSR